MKDFEKDVTFEFQQGGGEIEGHKLILSAASPVFRAMFSGKFKEKNKVQIEDISQVTFQRLMRLVANWSLVLKIVDENISLTVFSTLNLWN